MLDILSPIYAKTDDELLKEFGSLLKQRRIAANLTQLELAEATGISKIQISKIERTGLTSLATFVALSRKLGLLPQLLSIYEMPKLTPIQKYELEQKGTKAARERKRVKK